MARSSTTDKIEGILRNRTYDRHAYDEEVFGELLDEIDVAVRNAVAVAVARAAER